MGWLFIAVTMCAVCGEPSITGNFRRDVAEFKIVDDGKQPDLMTRDQQNPFVNGLFSLLVPGAGQYRTERYTKATIFFGAELACIALAVISDKYGDDKTAEFQRYAEAHWSPVRYAEWIRAHGVSDYGPLRSIDLDKVRRNDFSEINEWESAPATGKFGFSHQLPPFGDQQYYELIGKYYQFKFGWDTYPKDVNGFPKSDGKDYFNNFEADAQIKNYAKERGKANDYYYAASFALSAMVINHAVSAIDAFLSTKNYNTEVSATLEITPVEGAEGKRLLSQVKVSVGF